MSVELNIDNKIVDFIGPEGAGKSTIAKRLSSHTQKPYISMGDILREMAKNDTTRLGDECRSMFKEHRYLDPVMLLLIQEKYFREQERLCGGFILDGGLRTTAEVAGFPQMLEKSGRKMPMNVVYLDVSEEVSLQRLTGEGGRRREDDTLEGVLNRLKNFNKNLEERLTLIAKFYTILKIDATGTIDETYEELCKALGEQVK